MRVVLVEAHRDRGAAVAGAETLVLTGRSQCLWLVDMTEGEVVVSLSEFFEVLENESRLGGVVTGDVAAADGKVVHHDDGKPRRIAPGNPVEDPLVEILDWQTPFVRALGVVLNVDVRERCHEPLAGNLHDELVQVHAPVL